MPSCRPAPGLELPLGYVFAAIPVGAALIILPMLRNIYRALEEPMAETLLIIFIVFILLGMPISIAMGVGALGAAMFYPAAQSDHHPDPLRRPAVGLLPAAVGAAVHPRRQHRGARRRRARASSISPPRWSAASAAGSPT